MMSYAIAKAAFVTLQQEAEQAGHNLKAIPGVGTGPMGRTPDVIRETSQYRAARAAHDAATEAAHRFSKEFLKAYRRQWDADSRADRDARRAALVATPRPSV